MTRKIKQRSQTTPALRPQKTATPHHQHIHKMTMQLRGSGITLEKIMSQSDSQRKTNIICTMGPSCWDTEMLVSLIDQGMNVARLNFSHGDHKSHGETVQRLHEAKAQRPDKHVALMLDTKGPEIRTGFLQPDFKPLHLVRGQSLELITDYSVLGDNTKLAVSYKALPESCHVGMTILAADGSLVMTVTEILETSVMVTLDCNATIGERKNMNLPGVKVDLPGKWGAMGLCPGLVGVVVGCAVFQCFFPRLFPSPLILFTSTGSIFYHSPH